MDYGSTYTVTVTKQIADTEGLHPESDYSFDFTTRSLINVFTPNSNTAIPSGVGVNADLTVSFVQPIDSQTLNGIMLEKLDDQGNTTGSMIETGKTLSSDGMYLTVTHANALDYGAKYRLTLPSTLADTQGCILGDINYIEFNTEPCQLDEQPVFTQNGTPSSNVTPNLNYSFATTLNNLSNTQQDMKVRMVVRGGKGARNDHGGTILGNYLNNATVAAQGSTSVSFNEFSFTNEITGNVYVDVYVWDSNGLFSAAKPVHYQFPVVSQ